MRQELKILVCDRNQTFFRYFRKRFPDVNFSFFSDVKNGSFSFNEFNLILFIQEGPIEEYMTFFKLFEVNPPLIFGVYKRKPVPAKYQIDQIGNVRFLYMLETKDEISNQLAKYFNNIILQNK